MNGRQIFLIHIVLKCQRSSEAQTFARLQHFCTFVIEIKDRMQYCMEESKRGCRARALGIGTRLLYALRAALRAARAGVIIEFALWELEHPHFVTYENHQSYFHQVSYAWIEIIDNKKINIEHKTPQIIRESRGVFDQPSVIGSNFYNMNRQCLCCGRRKELEYMHLFTFAAIYRYIQHKSNRNA